MMKLSPELIEKLDQVGPSPALMAAQVMSLLSERCPELTNQQLQCFAVEYLASQVITGELGFAEREIKEVAKIYYYSHYYRLSCQVPQDSGQKKNTQTESLLVSEMIEEELRSVIPSQDSETSSQSKS
jgi:hypothetical protein